MATAHNPGGTPPIGGSALDTIAVSGGLVRAWCTTTVREMFEDHKVKVRSVISGAKQDTVEKINANVNSLKDQLNTAQRKTDSDLKLIKEQQLAILTRLGQMEGKIELLSKVEPPKNEEVLGSLARVEKSLGMFIRTTSEARIAQSGVQIKQDEKFEAMRRLQQQMDTALDKLLPLPELVETLVSENGQELKKISDRLSVFEDQVNEVSLQRSLVEGMVPDPLFDEVGQEDQTAEDVTPEEVQNSSVYEDRAPSLDSGNSSAESATQWPCLTTPSNAAQVEFSTRQLESSFADSEYSPPSDYAEPRAPASLVQTQKAMPNIDHPALAINTSLPVSPKKPRGLKRKRTKSKSSEETVVKKEDSPMTSILGSATASTSRKRQRKGDRTATTPAEREQDGWPPILPSAADDSEEMIACDACDRWYHMTCVGLKEEPDTWSCIYCIAVREGRRLSVREGTNNGKCPRPGCDKEEGRFVMESIIGRRKSTLDDDATYDYLVKWEDYKEDRAEWYPDCKDTMRTPTTLNLIREFYIRAREELGCPVADTGLVMLDQATDNGWDSDTGELAKLYKGPHAVAQEKKVAQWSL